MTQAPIPFADQQASGWEEVGGASPIAMNVLVDGRGTVRRRPGLRAYVGATQSVVDPTGLNGIFAAQTGLLLAVGRGTTAARNVYKVTTAGSGPVRPTLGAGALRGRARPVFAETEAMVVVAGGENLQKITFANEESARLGGDPPFATHVIAQGERLLCNNTREPNRVYFSDLAAGSSVAGHEKWNGVGTSGFFGSDARPDRNLAVVENTNEIFVFGNGTLQVFGTDPNLVYAAQAAVEVGIGAPYSLIKDDQDFVWLDRFRRFVRSNGRGHTVVSDSIAKTLQEISVIDDCFGYRVVLGSFVCLVWTFPTDGRTFVLQQDIGWGQWSGFDDTTANWTRFSVDSQTIVAGDNANIVGTVDGFVRELSLDAPTDSGARVRAYIVSGYQDRGTDGRKHCNCVNVALRRGSNADATTPSAFLLWRDRPGAWEGRIPIELGAPGDTDPVLSFYSLGTYRRRQWGFEFSGSDELALVRVTEDFDILEG